MSENDERQTQILQAAKTVIIRQGYDKTTMSDIADEAGVSRGTVYLYFESKETLFESLIYQEMRHYGQTWIDQIEHDPRGGTIGSMCRVAFYAISSRPFMAALMRQDRHVFGNYLKKPDNLFANMQSGSAWTDTMRAMQDAGVIRKDIDPVVMAHVVDMMSYGLVYITDFRNVDEMPPFEVLLEAMAKMLDHYLTPEAGANLEAGKMIIRQLADSSRAQFEQMKQAKTSKSEE